MNAHHVSYWWLKPRTSMGLLRKSMTVTKFSAGIEILSDLWHCDIGTEIRHKVIFIKQTTDPPNPPSQAICAQYLDLH